MPNLSDYQPPCMTTTQNETNYKFKSRRIVCIWVIGLDQSKYCFNFELSSLLHFHCHSALLVKFLKTISKRHSDSKHFPCLSGPPQCFEIFEPTSSSQSSLCQSTNNINQCEEFACNKFIYRCKLGISIRSCFLSLIGETTPNTMLFAITLTSFQQ